MTVIGIIIGILIGFLIYNIVSNCLIRWFNVDTTTGRGIIIALCVTIVVIQILKWIALLFI